MRTEDAISSLKFIKNSFTGDCTTNTLVPISRVDIEALNIAIKSLENQKKLQEELEKIKGEMIEHRDNDKNDYDFEIGAMNNLIAIVDKHIKENKQ